MCGWYLIVVVSAMSLDTIKIKADQHEKLFEISLIRYKSK